MSAPRCPICETPIEDPLDFYESLVIALTINRRDVYVLSAQWRGLAGIQGLVSQHESEALALSEATDLLGQMTGTDSVAEVARASLEATNLDLGSLPSAPAQVVQWMGERLSTFSNAFVSDMERATRETAEKHTLVLSLLSGEDLGQCVRLLEENPSVTQIFLGDIPGIESVLLSRDEVLAEARLSREYRGSLRPSIQGVQGSQHILPSKISVSDDGPLAEADVPKLREMTGHISAVMAREDTLRWIAIVSNAVNAMPEARAKRYVTQISKFSRELVRELDLEDVAGDEIPTLLSVMGSVLTRWSDHGTKPSPPRE